MGVLIYVRFSDWLHGFVSETSLSLCWTGAWSDQHWAHSKGDTIRPPGWAELHQWNGPKECKQKVLLEGKSMGACSHILSLTGWRGRGGRTVVFWHPVWCLWEQKHLLVNFVWCTFHVCCLYTHIHVHTLAQTHGCLVSLLRQLLFSAFLGGAMVSLPVNTHRQTNTHTSTHAHTYTHSCVHCLSYWLSKEVALSQRVTTWFCKHKRWHDIVEIPSCRRQSIGHLHRSNKDTLGIEAIHIT